MERELWDQLYALAKELDNTNGNQFYRDWEIVVVYFWAVVHDRPTSWAVESRHWPERFRHRRMPCQSTLSRRLRSPGILTLISAIESKLGSSFKKPLVWSIDGKALPIGAYSKDSEAKLGFNGSGFSKGYKLHAIWAETGIPSAWCIESLNVGEARVARRLVEQHNRQGYLLGDRQYDSNPLHQLTSEKGIQLVAPQKRKGKLSPSRKHSPARIRCFEILETTFGKQLYALRRSIEQSFGNLTSFGAGLGPLPAWVRRKHRVQLWVQAKIVINALRITYKKSLSVHAHA